MRKVSKIGANVTSFLHMLLNAWKSLEINTTQDYAVFTRRAVEQMNGSEWDYAVVDISIGPVIYTIFKLWGADKAMINYSPLPLLVPLPPWPFPAMMAPGTDLPYGFDQFDTALRLETQGLGIQMLPKEVSREKVVKAVTRVKLGEFSRKVKRMSKLLRSEVEEGLKKRQIWWSYMRK